LGLLATDDAAGGNEPAGPALRGAADWLATVQRPDGSVAVSASTPSPGWMTPYALLLWTALGVQESRVRVGSKWLLGQKGRTLDKADDPRKIAGHDTTLVGWPWVDDTHSWLEPTAMAVLALGRLGLSGHGRVREGIRLIRDREVEPGGWNYGNKSVFGRPLRAQPAPTGLALLALSGTEPRSAVVDRAVRYLLATLPGVRASASLGWGLVGLRAWGEAPAVAADWVSEATLNVVDRPDAAPKLACLLLASGGRTLELFGRPRRGSAVVSG
ncbi:MAG: terpene cyclase/mutase family protein, partial [Planctomycetia bacterium]|nr:terpene cyclase/mutase family protein [Planctomycetia bacterium]